MYVITYPCPNLKLVDGAPGNIHKWLNIIHTFGNIHWITII